MSDIAFTFDWYDGLLGTLDDRGYAFADFHEDVTPESVVLRHDVDWSPRKAVRLAEIEAEHGVAATYFFLVSSPFYNVLNREARERIRRIRDLGHEIGLHFSTHQHFESTPDGAEGDAPPDSELRAAVDAERDVLETVTGAAVEVVSFHNPPSWTFRRSFEGFVSTYESRFFDEVEYRADSNQRWRDQPPFDGGVPSKVQILTHPVLWGERDAFATDRLREERDYLSARIGDHLEVTDRTWQGTYGLPRR